MAVTTSSGNGFALYNGVKLLNIDSVWTDKTTYPYAVIAMGEVYMLVVSSVPLCYYADAGGITNSADGAIALYGLMEGQWVLAEAGDAPQYGLVGGSEATWANHDILNTDNSVYFAASDPIPLDGMNVIEWDGDTTGRAVVEGVMYKVSNVTDIDLNGCSAYYKASDGSVYGGSLIWQEAQTGLNVGVYGGDTPMCAVINSVDGLEDGLYFSSFSEGEYTTIFAYPASGGGSGDDEGDTAPAPKHYCRINGTIYEVEGGTAKMGGTFCEVKSGTVLIDGTVYDFALN